tara:strand:- start:3006 stop:3353 length:348 start_codon:yes stop_codon:yes gene_type:complete
MIDPNSFTNELYKEEKNNFNDKIVQALKTVYDPEIPVDVYELGLIYDVQVDNGHAIVKMTLTAPNCPVADSMPKMVELALLTINEINSTSVELVWDPPWNSTMMSESARLELGME